jgi:tetratricopeptide (TPR) repeat protein
MANAWVVIGMLALSGVGPAGQPAGPQQATSLLGKPLFAAAPSEEALKQLKAAVDAHKAKPGDADALIWAGRRYGYVGAYRDAIATFTDGIARHPSDARMYRHRGHRHITVREFRKAIDDLSKAAELVAGKADEVEPDGQPNARNIPTSTLNSNIYYHLGLAHYLVGEFDKAAAAYRKCLEFSKNPDMLAATSHWLYMTLRRLDRRAEADAVLAPIARDMDIIENASYHKLLLMYKGLDTPKSLMAAAKGGGLDGATIGYGVANWHLYNGRPDEAKKILEQIVDANASQWAAFGYIAAEADYARIVRCC